MFEISAVRPDNNKTDAHCSETCALRKCYNDTEKPESIPVANKARICMKQKSRPCDKKSNLYVLRQNKTILDNIKQPESIAYCNTTSEHYPFIFKLIPHTNLMLVVINKTCTNKITKTLSASPEEIQYNYEFPCYKTYLNNLPRRRLEGCFTEHEQVSIKWIL